MPLWHAWHTLPMRLLMINKICIQLMHLLTCAIKHPADLLLLQDFQQQVASSPLQMQMDNSSSIASETSISQSGSQQGGVHDAVRCLRHSLKNAYPILCGDCFDSVAARQLRPCLCCCVRLPSVMACSSPLFALLPADDDKHPVFRSAALLQTTTDAAIQKVFGTHGEEYISYLSKIAYSPAHGSVNALQNLALQCLQNFKERQK